MTLEQNLRKRIRCLRDYLKTIEMAYDDRADDKIDIEQMKTLAGYALENDKKNITFTLEDDEGLLD